MSESAQSSEPKQEMINKSDFDAQIARAQRFEGMVTDLEKKLDRFKNIDPDKYKALEEEVNNLKRDAAVGDPKKFDEELGRREQSLRESIQKDVDSLKESVKNLTAENKELKVTNKVFSMLSSQLVDGAQEDAKDYIRRFCDIGEGGEIVVKDEAGKPRYKKGSTTQLMGSEDFIEWLKEIRGFWFSPKGKPGVNPNGQSANGNMGSNVSIDSWLQMSPAERQSQPIALQREMSVKILSANRRMN